MKKLLNTDIQHGLQAMVGDGNVTSSGYPKAPKNFPPIWNASPASLRWQKCVFRYIQNKEGEITAPWLTPFLTLKVSHNAEFPNS